MADPRSPAAIDPVRETLASCRPHIVAAAIFSAGVNILYLVPTIYMMQVYNRVVPTGGLATLAALSAVMLFGLGVLSALDWLRGRLLIRAGAQLEQQLAGNVLETVMARPGLSRLERSEAMRHFDQLRAGVASAGVVAILDAPWAPVYLVAATLLHPALGLFVLVAGAILFGLAWHGERAIKAPLEIANEASRIAYSRQHHIVSHAEEVRALGLGTALARRQVTDRVDANRLHAQTGFANGNHAGLVKFLRLAFQSGALGVGAWLAVRGSVSGGAVFAASLLLSRALAPVEQINAAWKQLLETRTAYTRLSALFGGVPERSHTALPAPTGALSIERLTVLAPQTERIALADITAQIAAGEIIGLVGMSGAGKSTLLRALAGATAPARGHVRFDGASASDWDGEALARHIGYLPQNFVLFPGSVKENISRFRGLVGDDPATVDACAIEAAKAIGAHDMILRLPDGYDTEIGPGGAGLSSGQTQRIAIARALYGRPRVLLLDEPTAHLDAESQHAFTKTLAALRQDKVTVVFATHSSDILAHADKLMLIRDGRLEKFGPLADPTPALKPVSHAPARTV